jgi:ketosteroid isomerase-like protein
MSQENVEIVRRFWDASDRQDLQAVFALYDPAVVWVQHSGPFDMQGTYLGHDGVRKAWRDWVESFKTVAVHAHTFIDAGESVIVGWRMSGEGKASDAPAHIPGWSIHTLRNCRLIRIDVFNTKAEALEAVGLSEQDAHADSS